MSDFEIDPALLPDGWDLPLTGQYDVPEPYVVSDDVFDEYGEGDTVAEALADYFHNLKIYYDLLNEHPISELSQQVIEALKPHIERLNMVDKLCSHRRKSSLS